MKLINKLATAGAVAVMGLGLGAASASAAIDLSPANTPFTGNQTTQNVFTANGAPVFCDTAQFTGNTANATTTAIPFRASYADCTMIIGGIPFDASVTVHTDWVLTYVSGDATSGVTANVDILPPVSGPAVEIHIDDIGCTISIDAQNGLSHVVAENDPFDTAVNIDATVTDIHYTSQGNCLGLPATGDNGTYDGSVSIPDITITDV